MRRAIIIGAVLAAAAAACLYVVPGNAPGQREPAPALLPEQSPGFESSWGADHTAAVGETLEDGTEVVLGLRVRKDRNCRVELKDYVTPDGEMFSAYSCTPDNPQPEHPYAVYDDATLEAMAYSDAEAAATLGQRLIGRDRRKSYDMLVRAAALDGNTQHLYWLADQAFSAVRINDDVQVANVMRRYELAALATHLGGSDTNSRFWRSELVNAGVDDEQLNKLDRRVRELLRTVRDIQVTVYGEIRHGGHSDA